MMILMSMLGHKQYSYALKWLDSKDESKVRQANLLFGRPGIMGRTPPLPMDLKSSRFSLAKACSPSESATHAHWPVSQWNVMMEVSGCTQFLLGGLKKLRVL